MSGKCLLRLSGALILGAGGLLTVGGAPATADTSGATTCVEPDRSIFRFERLDPSTYRVSLRDPATVTCTAITFNVSSYRIPDTWNRDGWNETALPQTEFAYTALTFPAGGIAAVTATVSLPDCGPFQTDLYTGPRLTNLEWPSPMADVRITGTMVDQASCSQPSQSPSPSTSASTPAPETSVTPPATGTPASVAPSTAQVSVLPTHHGSSSPANSQAAAPERNVKVLGSKVGLADTGGPETLREQVMLAIGLIGLGGLLLLNSLRKPSVRHRRH